METGVGESWLKKLFGDLTITELISPPSNGVLWNSPNVLTGTPAYLSACSPLPSDHRDVPQHEIEAKFLVMVLEQWW